MTDGQPALGWVSRVWRDGTKLMADFVDMPTVIYEAIRKKLYKTVSIELLRDVQAGTRKMPWVLDAVSLLGADQPAVGTLKDLEVLTMSRKPVLQARARVAFTRGVTFSIGAHKGMDKAEVEALLAEQATKLTADLTAKFSAHTAAEVAKVTAAAKADSEAAAKKAAAESHRAQIKAKFEAAVKAQIILPAKRESFFRFNKVDDDTVVTTIKLEEVDAYIEDVADPVKLAASKRTQTKGGDVAVDPLEAKLSAAEVVAYRARKLCFERKQDPNNFAFINAATVEVLKGDKALGESYKRLEDAPAAA